jgi:hypothetical protein
MTALAYAAKRGHIDCLHELINSGAPTDSKNCVRVFLILFQKDCIFVLCQISVIFDVYYILVSFTYRILVYVDDRSP